MFRRVAIIGGGAAAAALLSELIAHPRTPPLHVDWFTGGTGAAGRGVAYSSASPRHLLNVRAASMGVLGGRPRGFLDFAQQREPTVAGTDFLPRRWYGEYLGAEIAELLTLAQARGTHVRLLKFAIDAVVPEQDGVTVLHGEQHTRVDAAVLALGALPAQPLAGVTAAALSGGRYVVDPWAWLAQLRDNDAPREVVLIGLGLTAADVLLELSARWPQAHFTALSRRGHLPEAHLPTASVPVDDSSDWIEAMHNDPNMAHWMRVLREAIAASRDWRTVIDSLRPHTAALWALLPLPERARFLRHARWAWERARHRMAPQVSECLADLERSGRLHRMRGHMHAVDAAADGLRLEIRPTGAAAVAERHADWAIQTIGLNTDIAHTPHPLVRQLVTNGHIEPDPLGLGCRATTDGRLCHGGQPWPCLFALGSLLRGTLWECSAMPEIRHQARTLAVQLLAE